MFTDDPSGGQNSTAIVGGQTTSQFQMQGRVMNPLKLSLYRYQYEQLLDSVKSLIGGDGDEEGEEEVVVPPTKKDPPSRKTSFISNPSVDDPSGRKDPFFSDVK